MSWSLMRLKGLKIRLFPAEPRSFQFLAECHFLLTFPLLISFFQQISNQEILFLSESAKSMTLAQFRKLACKLSGEGQPHFYTYQRGRISVIRRVLYKNSP